jgi:hypothetical protein
MTFEALARAFEALSPIELDGQEFAFPLSHFREPLQHQTQAIYVSFSAVSDDGVRHNGELYLRKDRYSDLEVVDLAVPTIREIVNGSLPPGARQLL